MRSRRRGGFDSGTVLRALSCALFFQPGQHPPFKTFGSPWCHNNTFPQTIYTPSISRDERQPKIKVSHFSSHTPVKTKFTMSSEPESYLKTDNSIATGKITTTTAESSSRSKKPPITDDDEASLDGFMPNNNSFPDLPEFTPPLRIKVGKLGGIVSSGSVGSLNGSSSGGFASTLEIPRKLEKEALKKISRRKSDSNSRRSGSQSPAYDGGSSISSLEDMGFDTDMLTDKMGMLELDWKEQQEHADRLNRSCSNLPPVSERMSEAMLEDNQAFLDLKREDGYTSRGTSITTGGEVSSNILEPLDEVDEEDQEDDRRVKIMNMEDILEVPDEDAFESTPAGSGPSV